MEYWGGFYQTNKGCSRHPGRSDAHSGREGAMNLEQLLPLAESIFENWDVEKFDESMLVPVSAGVEHESFYKY